MADIIVGMKTYDICAKYAIQNLCSPWQGPEYFIGREGYVIEITNT